MEERRGAYRVLVEKPEVKITLGRPRHRRGDNIKMNFRLIGRQVYIVGWCCSG
jgi:hypothetical protein